MLLQRSSLALRCRAARRRRALRLGEARPRQTAVAASEPTLLGHLALILAASPAGHGGKAQDGRKARVCDLTWRIAISPFGVIA